MAVSLHVWLSCTDDILLVYFFMICATVPFEVVGFELFSTEVQIFAILLYRKQSLIEALMHAGAHCPPLQGHHHINQPIEDTFLKV